MRLRLSLAALLLALPAAALAQTGAEGTQPSAYDKAWSNFTEWYEDDTNPVVQRVLLSGRFHYDFTAIDADPGNHDEWNVRRLRIGPRITLFRKFTFHSELELDPQRHDPFYVRFTDFYLMYAGSA
jgi:phosphate-selective porin